MAILRRKLQMKVTDRCRLCLSSGQQRTGKQIAGRWTFNSRKGDYERLDSGCDKATSTRCYKLRVRSNASLKRLYDSRKKRHQAAIRSPDSAPTNCLIARSSRNFWTMSSHHRRRRGCGFASALCVPRRFCFGEF